MNGLESKISIQVSKSVYCPLASGIGSLSANSWKNVVRGVISLTKAVILV